MPSQVRKKDIVCAFHGEMEDENEKLAKTLGIFRARIDRLSIAVIVLSLLTGVEIATNVISIYKP